MSTITQTTILPRELQQKYEAGEAFKLIDVRTPVEFRETHVEFASNVPLDKVDPAEVMERHDAGDDPLYIMCRSGNRAQQAIEKFNKSGYENVINVEGGMLQWEADGQPAVRGKKAISLERQVPHRGGFDCLYWCDARLLRGSCVGVSLCVCWSRVGFCGSVRHLRHGHDAGEDAVESGQRGKLPREVSCSVYLLQRSTEI